MKLRPILFNTEMVQAILNGKKTVTRRKIRPQPKMQLSYCFGGPAAGMWGYPPPNAWKESGWGERYRRIDGLTAADDEYLWTPPCVTGDILYVREKWAYGYIEEEFFQEQGVERSFIPLEFGESVPGMKPGFFYRADWLEVQRNGPFIAWRPSIHMPRQGARLFLKVTEVGVERLQSIRNGPLDRISKEGCRDETEFSTVWNSTIRKEELDQYGWDADPWVWVIEFERCEKPELGCEYSYAD